MFWYSGFLPYHKDLIEKPETIPQTDVNQRTKILKIYFSCRILLTPRVLFKVIYRILNISSISKQLFIQIQLFHI
jgi:hypothetical protein